MPIPGADSGGLGATARRIAERASSVVRLEIELAKAELVGKVKAFALGIGLALAAVVLLLFGIGFGLAAFAAGLETTLPTWASLLVVTGTLLLAAGALGAAAAASFKRGTPPVPEQAIEEARRTTDLLRSNGR